MPTLFYQPDCFELAQRIQLLVGETCALKCTDAPFKGRFLKRLPKVPSLLVDSKGLWLVTHEGEQVLKIQPNWLGQQKRVVCAGRKSELILRATKVVPDMRVIDATAGLGSDSILLAGRGAQVTMLEQQPLMYALLCDAMRQIGEQPNWHKLKARLQLVFTDAVAYMSAQTTQVDLVYLDPMFPDNSYKSAQVGKHMQALHTLAQPPTVEQEEALLSAALSAGKRVVVKRPRHAPYLAQTKPHNQWSGDAIRFDGYEQA